MTEQDKEVFASAMRTCIGDRYLNVYLNDERINSWFEGLKGYKLQDVNMALRTLSEENTQPFSLAMVLKRLKTFVGENPAELQMLAQMGLNEFLREYDSVYDFCFADWKVAFAISTAGNLWDWGTSNEFALSQLKKNYFFNYEHADSVTDPKLRKCLVKGKQNYSVRCVKFIGDWNTCFKLAQLEYEPGVKWECRTENPNVQRLPLRATVKPKSAEMPQDVVQALSILDDCAPCGKSVSKFLLDAMQQSRRLGYA